MSKKIVAFLVVVGVVIVALALYYGRGFSQQDQTAGEAATSTESGGAIPTFTTAKISPSSPEKYCVFEVTYPVAHIDGNADLEAWLNTYLRSRFVPPDAQINECETSAKSFTAESFMGKPVTETTSISYNVKLVTGDLVSMTYVASSFFEGAAHPNNVIEAFTLDLTDRSVVAFNDLLQPNTGEAFNDLLYAAVAEAFAAAGTEPYFDRATFLSQYTKDSYDFFLTKDALVVVNLFDIHALQGLEPTMPFFKLKAHIDPHGVLMRLVSQDT